MGPRWRHLEREGKMLTTRQISSAQEQPFGLLGLQPPKEE